jgi:hypothetical protein
MATSGYRVLPIEGLKPSNRRAVVFLTKPDDKNLDAKAVFDNLDNKQKRALLTRFDHWIEGAEGATPQDKYFHGWPNDKDYKSCFVFKWKHKNGHHRLYGFLFNPQPNTRPNFRVCVLASHAIKSTWETDPSELKGAKALHDSLPVIAALKALFPDKKVKQNDRR